MLPFTGAPFVKPHCVLIVAAATVLLMKRRSLRLLALSIRVNCNLILSNEAYRTEGILIFPLPYIIIRFAKRIDKERDQYDRV